MRKCYLPLIEVDVCGCGRKILKWYLLRIHQKGKTRNLLQSIVMEPDYLRYSDKNITVYSNLISSPFSVAAISTLGFKV